MKGSKKYETQAAGNVYTINFVIYSLCRPIFLLRHLRYIPKLNTNTPKTGDFWRILVKTANVHLYYTPTYTLLCVFATLIRRVARSTTSLTRFST